MNNHHNCRGSIKLAIGSFHRRAGSLVTLALAAAIGALFAGAHAVEAGQVLSNTVPPVAATLQPIGPLDGAQVLNLAIALPLRNQQGLQDFLQQLYDPASPSFRQYLTPAQFWPGQQDYQAVVAFAQANNLTVTYEYPNRVILDVTGTVADIEKALNVNMLVYQHPTEDRTFFAPDVEPCLDLTVSIQGIQGLNNYALPKPGSIGTPLGPADNPMNGLVQSGGLLESDGNTNHGSADSQFLLTDSMSAGRFDHTATLLPSGLLLVAGGWDYSGLLPGVSLTNADLYNPSNGTWSSTGALNTARYAHTATLLPNDSVLVAGGIEAEGESDEAVWISYAELYNPATESWTDTGSMNSIRVWHTATLLPNGLVLAAGGDNDYGAVDTSELYSPGASPSTGTWSYTTGSMNTARMNHTATLLPNGLVLVAGGQNSSGYTATSELFNLTTGMWAYTTYPMNTARAWHTATLLPNGYVLVAGGENSSGYIASCELYNIATQTWTYTAYPMNTARGGFTANVLTSGLVPCGRRR